MNLVLHLEAVSDSVLGHISGQPRGNAAGNRGFRVIQRIAAVRCRHHEPPNNARATTPDAASPVSLRTQDVSPTRTTDVPGAAPRADFPAARTTTESGCNRTTPSGAPDSRSLCTTPADPVIPGT